MVLGPILIIISVVLFYLWQSTSRTDSIARLASPFALVFFILSVAAVVIYIAAASNWVIGRRIENRATGQASVKKNN